MSKEVIEKDIETRLKKAKPYNGPMSVIFDHSKLNMWGIPNYSSNFNYHNDMFIELLKMIKSYQETTQGSACFEINNDKYFLHMRIPLGEEEKKSVITVFKNYCYSKPIEINHKQEIENILAYVKKHLDDWCCEAIPSQSSKIYKKEIDLLISEIRNRLKK